MTKEQEFMMYTFKGTIIKGLSNKLRSIVNIKVFYKEETDIIGVILSVPNEPCGMSKLYHIDRPWERIQSGESIQPIINDIVQKYKSYVMSRYFVSEFKVPGSNEVYTI